MKEKKAKITKCVFTKEWINPSGTLVYYHEITFSNGDVGTCGKMMKYPKELSEGTELTYTIDGTGKIKVIPNTMKNSNSSNSNTAKPAGKMSFSKKHDDFLGYAWSYAKDLIIAGKSMQDVEELNKVARYIYEEIGKMLENR